MCLIPQLLMHVFCTSMDDMIPDFTTHHVRDPSDIRGPYPRVTLLQTRTLNATPYYLVTHETREWRPEPGRNNVFHAIVLFVLYVHKYMQNRIGQVDLNDMACARLGRIVQ